MTDDAPMLMFYGAVPLLVFEEENENVMNVVINGRK